MNLQKSLERESINNKLLLQDLTNLKKINDSLMQNNETLLNSVNITQTNLEKLHLENTYYKEYFYKYLQIIKHQRRPSLTDFKYLQNGPNFELTTANPNKILQKTNTMPNNTFLKEEIEENSLILDLKTSQAFLINLARDLYLDSKVRKFYSVNQQLSKICNIASNQMKLNETKSVLKPKRCLSNPLHYISEGLKNLDEEPPLFKKKRFFKKREMKKKTILKGKNEIERLLISPMPSTYDIKNGSMTPFLLDISKINAFGFEHSFMD